MKKKKKRKNPCTMPFGLVRKTNKKAFKKRITHSASYVMHQTSQITMQHPALCHFSLFNIVFLFFNQFFLINSS